MGNHGFLLLVSNLGFSLRYSIFHLACLPRQQWLSLMALSALSLARKSYCLLWLLRVDFNVQSEAGGSLI